MFLWVWRDLPKDHFAKNAELDLPPQYQTKGDQNAE